MSVSVLFERLSARSRSAKLAMLRHLIGTNPAPMVLDLGGQVESTQPLLEILPRAARVTVLNVMPTEIQRIRGAALEVQGVIGDARSLPFPDRAFDLVYSNAVIEHLGTGAAQYRMANEIQRVGRTWFITTPNRWFPFEFHTRLPLVSWLPPALLHRSAAAFSYNHVARRYMTGNDQSDLCLLSACRLQRMFPSSKLVKNRITLWPETLTVYGGVE